MPDTFEEMRSVCFKQSWKASGMRTSKPIQSIFSSFEILRHLCQLRLLLLLLFKFIFWPNHMVCRILVP